MWLTHYLEKPDLSVKKESKPVIKRNPFINKNKTKIDFEQSTTILLDRSIVRKQRVIIDSTLLNFILIIESLLKKVDSEPPKRPDTPSLEERPP